LEDPGELLLGEGRFVVEDLELDVGNWASIAGRAASTDSAARTSLAPVAFCACSVIAGFASTYELTRLGS